MPVDEDYKRNVQGDVIIAQMAERARKYFDHAEIARLIENTPRTRILGPYPVRDIFLPWYSYFYVVVF